LLTRTRQLDLGERHATGLERKKQASSVNTPQYIMRKRRNAGLYVKDLPGRSPPGTLRTRGAGRRRSTGSWRSRTSCHVEGNRTISYLFLPRCRPLDATCSEMNRSFRRIVWALVESFPIKRVTPPEKEGKPPGRTLLSSLADWTLHERRDVTFNGPLSLRRQSYKPQKVSLKLKKRLPTSSVRHHHFFCGIESHIPLHLPYTSRYLLCRHSQRLCIIESTKR
jgi:hypothetical protein